MCVFDLKKDFIIVEITQVKIKVECQSFQSVSFISSNARMRTVLAGTASWSGV